MITALAADEPEPKATGGLIPSGAVFLTGHEGCTLVIPLQPESRARELLASAAYFWPRDVTISLSSMTINQRGQTR